MERDFEEGDKYKEHKLIDCYPDWLDLPESIATNIILEHLEIVDYIRFSAVCKKWQSIQKEHRIRYYPYPPPSPLPFPWLRCLNCSPVIDKEANIVFHLPDKQKTYKIPIPKPYRTYAFDYRHGWEIILLDQSLCIANPITGVQIELPPLPEPVCSIYVLPISHSPSDPDCTITIVNYNGKAYLYRLNGDSGWKTIKCRKLSNFAAVFCRNKIYCMNRCKRVWMIDTLLSDLVEQMIEMDCSELSAPSYEEFMLVNFFEEFVMVTAIYEELNVNCYGPIKEFEVYKADFSMNKWTRMDSLGEYALFLSRESKFPLPAVDVGCKKNTIYYVEGIWNSRLPWRAFDLSTKDWIDGPSMSLPCYHPWNGNRAWFLPTLDYFGVEKSNGACQIPLG